jgi:predicted ATPase
MNTPILAPSPLWRVELFGQLRAVRRAQTVTRFRRHKDGVLLAYLEAPLPGSGPPGRPHPAPVDPLVPLRHEVERHRGQVLESVPELLLAVFSLASDALAAAMAGQRMLSGSTPAGAGESNPTGMIREPSAPITGLRVALHTGEADQEGGFYRSQARGVTAPERLFHATGTDMPRRDFPPPKAGPFRQGQLPPPLTRFFGREEEIANLRRSLREPQTRLVTLTGPGASGKTRLALAVAEELRERYRGAVWFVPLADLLDVGQIVDSVGAALGLDRVPAADPLEAVALFLSDQPSLLVLDNFEQLVEEGAPEVRRLLDRVPTLTCLATSRQRLGLTGEREFVVHPLPVPYSPETVEETARFPSVQLFVDRAQAVRADFQATRANAAALAELCRRLEGLPLALELAAARSSLLSPAQLLEQLTRREGGPWAMLGSRQRDATPRHRSLRAALEWSYQLLAPELQQFFARLSVFRGGWTLEAAQAVCQAGDALDLLEQLRDGSLITVDTTEGEGRYRLLETLREYAWEQLAAAGARRERMRRHAAFFLAVAERADHALDSEDGVERLQEVQREYDNMQAALDGCVQSDPAQDGAAMS